MSKSVSDVDCAYLLSCPIPDVERDCTGKPLDLPLPCTVVQMRQHVALVLGLPIAECVQHGRGFSLSRCEQYEVRYSVRLEDGTVMRFKNYREYTRYKTWQQKAAEYEGVYLELSPKVWEGISHRLLSCCDVQEPGEVRRNVALRHTAEVRRNVALRHTARHAAEVTHVV